MKLSNNHVRTYSGIFLVFVVFFAVPWALHPLISPPQGLYPSNWTEVDLIRDRYPIHMVDPSRLADSLFWPFAQTRARLALVSTVVVSVFVLAQLLKNKTIKPLLNNNNANTQTLFREFQSFPDFLIS